MMRCRCRILSALLAALLLASAPAGARERLLLPEPDGWRTLSNLSTDHVRLTEFAIPLGTDLDPTPATNEGRAAPEGGADGEEGKGDGGAGFEKLSFEWFSHELAPGLDPLEVAGQLASSARQACPDATDEPVFAGMENGYRTVVRLITCPRRGRGVGGQVLMVKAIEGDTGHWVVVRGRAVPAFEQSQQPLSAAIIRAWSRDLRSISLCNPDTGEAHPCTGVD